MIRNHTGTSESNPVSGKHWRRLLGILNVGFLGSGGKYFEILEVKIV